MAKKFKPKDFETVNGSTKHAAIYDSMLRAPAFMHINNRQKLLYVYMKSQYYDEKRKPRNDTDIKEYQSDECFYFNIGLAEDYALYTRNNHTQFYKDIEVLAAHGFIERISNGQKNKKKSIYKFSGKWKNWNENADFRSGVNYGRKGKDKFAVGENSPKADEN